MPEECKFCDKPLATKSTLNRHIREVHKEKSYAVYDRDVWNYRCLEENCNTSFQNSKALISHLENIHNLKFETVIVKLKTLNEFYLWKTKIETSYKCQFIRKSAGKRQCHSLHFHCNRTRTSYVPKKDSERLRSQKKQGSCKTDSSCPSQIKVVKTVEGVRVEWQKYHYGHDLDLKHIRFPKHIRRKIFSKLVSGHTPQMILKSLRESTSEGEKLNLITLKDIRNIKNSYKQINLDNIGPDELKKTLAAKNISIRDQDLKAILFHKSGINSANNFSIEPKEDHTYANYVSETMNHEEFIKNENMEAEYNEENQENDIGGCNSFDEEPETTNDECYENENNQENLVIKYSNVSDCKNQEEHQFFEHNDLYEENEDDQTSYINTEYIEDDVQEEITVVLENPEYEELGSSEEVESREGRYTPQDLNDYVESDLNDPSTRHKYWIESQGALEKYKKENKELLSINQHMQNTIARLNYLVTDLKKKENGNEMRN